MTEAFLSVGTNMGDREDLLAKALGLLEGTPGIIVTKVSRVYWSKPWGIKEQPDFLNICVQIEVSLNPADLLKVCKQVELVLGRKKRQRWGPREIDVDILLIDGVTIDTPTLTIPHHHMLERRFVMDPLAEIAANKEIDGVAVGGLASLLREEDQEQTCEPDEQATQRLSELRRLQKA